VAESRNVRDFEDFGDFEGDLLSTHAIGTVRLLLGSLVLMLVGAGVMRMTGSGLQPAVLVIRGGSLEVEPWVGTLRGDGSDLSWDHAVSGVAVSVYKSQDQDQEFDLADPIMLSAVKTIRIALRVDSRVIDEALVVTLDNERVKFTAKGVALSKRGDVWVHPGFVQEGRRKLFEVAVLELLGANGQVVARYQNPDMGRRFRYRIKLTGN
jgi:uncharacterized membrane protein